METETVYCPKCGSQNQNATMYCLRCGEPLMHQEGNNMRNNNVYSNAQAYGGTQNGEGTTGRALRELLLSPLFLTAAIAFSVQILLGIIASAVGPSSFAAAFNTALEETDLYYSDPSAYYAFKDAISTESNGQHDEDTKDPVNNLTPLLLLLLSISLTLLIYFLV